MEVSELWFKDGTVVIRAQDKVFCLHAGLLAARSNVLQQILENKNDGNQVGADLSLDVTGLPLLTLQDAAHDVQNFFLAIYDPGFFEAPPTEVSINCVLGILKMSTKYQVQALRRRALSHLNLTFPLTLGEWDNRINFSTLSIRREAFTSIPFRSTFEAAITIVIIAQTENIPWILPAALYECCTYDLDHILSHPTWENGMINEEMKKAIILGAFKHREATQSVLRFLVTSTAEGCQQSDICLEAKRSCNEIYAGGFPMNNPLSIWDDGDFEAYLDGLCEACSENCWRFHEKARCSIWKDLPEMYGLKQWSVLEELYHTEMSL